MIARLLRRKTVLDVCLAMEINNKRLVYKRSQQFQDVVLSNLVVRTHRLRGPQRPATCENREAAKQCTLTVGEQAPTPFECILQCLVPGRRRRSPPCHNLESASKSGVYLGHRQRSHSGSAKLN